MKLNSLIQLAAKGLLLVLLEGLCAWARGRG